MKKFNKGFTSRHALGEPLGNNDLCTRHAPFPSFLPSKESLPLPLPLTQNRHRKQKSEAVQRRFGGTFYNSKGKTKKKKSNFYTAKEGFLKHIADCPRTLTQEGEADQHDKDKCIVINACTSRFLIGPKSVYCDFILLMHVVLYITRLDIDNSSILPCFGCLQSIVFN